MIIFKRQIENQIVKNLFKGGMVIILGPRQSGKTTLSQKIIKNFGEDGAYFNCEFADVRKCFVLGEPDKLLGLIKDKKIVVLDEAQTIQNIGKILKVFHDTYPEIQIIATGSSSFDLANKIKEPMTGRAFEFILPPLSYREIKESFNIISENKLKEIMLYGSYPAVIGAETIEQKKLELKKIATNYLYKDVYVFEQIHNPKVFEDLLLHLAYAVGGTISAGKLGRDLGVAPSTVERYIRLLEQSYVIKRIYSYSKNYANELKKSYKIYFFDTGVRNAIIGSFDFDDKNKGALFENLFFLEKMKKGCLDIFPPKLSFWRTKQGLEVDLIEERNEKIKAYECKFSGKSISFAKFLKYYKKAETYTVTPENIADFL